MLIGKRETVLLPVGAVGASGRDSQQAAPPHTEGLFSSQTQLGLCSAHTVWPRSPSSWGSHHVSGDPPEPVEAQQSMEVKGHVCKHAVKKNK